MLAIHPVRDRRVPLSELLRSLALSTLTGLLFTVTALAQVSPDQAADMLLNSARKAYNEKNHTFATGRFREFLTKFGSHKDAASARYGLALCLIEGPEKDYKGAVEQLQPIAGGKELHEFPFILYYLGLAQRGLGLHELAEAAAKPQEAPKRREAASHRFDEAAKYFGSAIEPFSARVKLPLPDEGKTLPIDLEWAARARCDRAEMLLRLDRVQEAQAAAEAFGKDPVLMKSRYRGLGLYYHGFASLLRKEYQAAGRSLSLLAPFQDPIFGTHARYLLARVHHLQDERAEATAHYEDVLTDFARQKQTATQALKQPAQFKNDPDEKARLEALLKDPPPDHVARSMFHLGVLLYEDGKFSEAHTHLNNFVQQFPGSPLALEAQLRQGYCQVQLKQFAEAIKTLQPLAEKQPRLADQVLFWIGKAQAGAADPAKPPEFEQALKTAISTYRKAADIASKASSDPEAKTRRGEILLELADTQQLAHQNKEAAATYAQLLGEKLLPARDEEVLQRQTVALHLAGDYVESDKVCAKFRETFPRSTLLPAVLFRHAENAYFTALAAEKNAPASKELPRLFDEAGKRYQEVITRFPEFAHVPLARYGLAMSHYRRHDWEKARAVLEAIPAAERTGDLAVVPYQLADCLIRLAPSRADDALAAGQLEQQLSTATELLDGFIAAQPNSPQTPDALLKLGHCWQRRASLLAQPPERAKFLASARTAYENLLKRFPQHALTPQAMIEQAKCFAQAGDPNRALTELRRFQSDPLKAAPAAPMALLQLATILRTQNKAAEGAGILAQCRQQHEPALAKDPARAAWVPLLQYHQGVCLKEAGKRPEARALFDQVVKQSPGRPEAAEAALRWGQCLKEEGQLKIAEARKQLAAGKSKPEQLAALQKQLDAGGKDIRDAVQYLLDQAEALKAKQPPVESRGRMLYDAAWGWRELAETEVAAARTKVQQERWHKLKEEAAKKALPGRPPLEPPLPEVSLAAVPLQPAEERARAAYLTLIASFPDLPLATDARLELSELHVERDEHDAAIKLLREALDKEPSAGLTDKVRLRLGACLAAKGDVKAALAQFEAVAQNPKSPLMPQAQYRAGECLLQQGKHAEAVKYLEVFRDKPPLQNLTGVSDRALLRLGHAYAHLKQWDASRQAHEQVPARFPQSPWVHEARYGIGWAQQNQKHYDAAVKAYGQVSAALATELAAKAQLQIGLCRLEQKQYPEAATALLVVPYTFDYPELSAVALCEAARTLTELKQRDQAIRLLERVIKEHPNSEWAAVAKERLEILKKS